MGPMGFLSASSSSFSHCCLWSSLLMSSDNRVFPSGSWLIKNNNNNKKVRDYRAQLTSFTVSYSESMIWSDPLLQFLQNIGHCSHHLVMQHWWLWYIVRTEIQNYLWNKVLVNMLLKDLNKIMSFLRSFIESSNHRMGDEIITFIGICLDSSNHIQKYFRFNIRKWRVSEITKR